MHAPGCLGTQSNIYVWIHICMHLSSWVHGLMYMDGGIHACISVFEYSGFNQAYTFITTASFIGDVT